MRIDDLTIEKRIELVEMIISKKRGEASTDWEDITDYFGLDESPETIRKSAVGLALADSCNMLVYPHIVDHASLEKQKLLDLRRGINNEIRLESRGQLLREIISDAIKNMPPIKAYKKPMVKLIGDINKELIVGLSDFHYGADFTVYGLYNEVINRYNPEVFDLRMCELISHIADIVRKEKPSKICITIIGDMIEGMIHTSQLSKIRYGVVDSTIKLSECLSLWLNELYNEVLVPINVYAVRGNHGEIRPLGTKAGQFPEENMERIVMHYLHQRFANHPYVQVEDDDAPMNRVVDVVGFKFLLIHGQGEDIEKIARDHLTLYNNQIDMFLCGHLHKSQTFTAGFGPGGNVLIERIPSLCGIDPYAQSKGYGAPPGATVIVMEEGYGRRCVYPIVLR